MSTYSVTSTNSSYATTGGQSNTAAQTTGMGMDTDAFMEVLLAQLRHQNPLEPMDDKEMLGQMASLNSLQELKQINTTLEALVELIQDQSAESAADEGTTA